ncbi:anti-sigma factor [Nitrospira sp.]|nr:anti-sigma factor [Nitrospira sp.]
MPEITCRQVTESTSAYLDERLDDASTSRMALHLATCAGCEAYATQIASVRQLLGGLPGPTAEPANLERLRRAFSLQQKRPPPAI